ncbi:MAG: hypothetical protein PHO10_12135, partial [Gemmiger sp.]|nr:hypothetical protein [Gemmiger sp.]
MKISSRPITRLWAICATAVVILSVLGTATYAWFTKNKYAQSDTVQVQSGSQSLKLEIAPAAGGPFAEEADITQISTGKVLDPVSTADLTTFFKSTAMEGNSASRFALTEQGYYHGQVFLRATAEGQSDAAKLDIYLDVDGIAVTDGETPGQLLNAARVGLVFSGGADAAKPVIFALSQNHNPGTDSAANTLLNGATPSGDFVLTGTAGNVSATADPALDPTAYTLTESGNSL